MTSNSKTAQFNCECRAPVIQLCTCFNHHNKMHTSSQPPYSRDTCEDLFPTK